MPVTTENTDRTADRHEVRGRVRGTRSVRLLTVRLRSSAYRLLARRPGPDRPCSDGVEGARVPGAARRDAGVLGTAGGHRRIVEG